MQTIGDRIRRRRKELKVSAKDLAQAAGLAPSTLYDIENGNQESSTKLHLIAKRLGVNVLWLGDGAGPMLSGEEVLQVSEPVVLYGIHLTIEAARLGEEWLKLEEPNRTAMAEAIYTMVAAQKRTTKAPKKRASEPAPHRSTRNN